MPRWWLAELEQRAFVQKQQELRRAQKSPPVSLGDCKDHNTVLHGVMTMLSVFGGDVKIEVRKAVDDE